MQDLGDVSYLSRVNWLLAGKITVYQSAESETQCIERNLNTFMSERHVGVY